MCPGGTEWKKPFHVCPWSQRAALIGANGGGAAPSFLQADFWRWMPRGQCFPLWKAFLAASALNKHMQFFLPSIIQSPVFPEACSLLYFLQTWDSYNSTPLADSTHLVWFGSKGFYKCWQQSSTFRLWEPSPGKCPTVAKTVPEILSVFCTRGKAIPSMSEYWRSVVPFWHTDWIDQTFIVSAFQGPEVRPQEVVSCEGCGVVKGTGPGLFASLWGFAANLWCSFLLFISDLCLHFHLMFSLCVWILSLLFVRTTVMLGSTLMASF